MLKSIFSFAANNIKCVLDIGSSKIVCIIFKQTSQGDYKIIGSGYSLSKGFKSGYIRNLKELEKSIINAIEEAEKQAGTSITKVIVTFSGGGIKSFVCRGQIEPNGVIQAFDQKNVIKKALKLIDREKYVILDYFPIEYWIDKHSSIADPVGLEANELTCCVNVITIPIVNLSNIANCLASCHLEIEEVMISPISNFYSCINAEEAENGVTLLDLGDSTCSYMLIRDNLFYDCGYIPLGGSHITNDIMKVFNTSYMVAERVKILHSGIGKNFMDSHKVIDVPIIANKEYDTKELDTITLASLCEVVTCRAEEIVEMIKNNIVNKFSSEFTCRIVITGGGAQLLGMKELIAKQFNAKVRLAKPYSPQDYVRGNKDLFFSSAIGTARGYILKNSFKSLKYEAKKRMSLGSKLYKWLEENI